MVNTTPSAAQLSTVTYMTGINTNGTVASQSFWTYAGQSAHKWSNDSSGNTLGTFSAAGTAGGTVTYAFDPSVTWTAAQQKAFTAVLTLWSDEANIRFVNVTNTTTADVLLSLGSNTGTYEEGAPSVSSSQGSTRVADELSPSDNGAQAKIVFDTSGGYGTLGSFSPGADYSYAALIHEAGHLLGLGHSGPYDDSAANADQVQASVYDSRQWTVMSYIQPTDTAARDYASYPVTGTNWTYTTTTSTGNGGTTSTFNPIAPQTPMPLDILAAQQLYGAPVTTALSGGQVFGFNANITDASEPFFDFTINQAPVITLWDAGIGNTLDLSGYSTASIVNLNPGNFSSAGGLTNNIGIAFGTRIDTAIGGAGNDSFTVNADADVINGGGGTNTAIFSGQRSQYVIAGTIAADTVTDLTTGIIDRLSNIQTLQFADTSVAVASAVSATILPTADFDGDGTSDILFQNTDGTIDNWGLKLNAIASSAIVANPTTAWHAVGTGDFNGDGRADILFQNDNGTIDIWQMNNHTILSSAVVANPGTTWHAVGIGDFNGDGKSDILFQNNDGSIDIWTMNGSAIAASAVVANPGTAWHAVATGDFNGDGKSDILFQNDDGTIDIWTMNGSTIAASGIVANPGTAWHAVATGDFNGDGKSDILFQNNDGTIDIWQMNGTTIASSAIIANPGPAWHAISAGDYNGDGKSDILFQNDDGTIDIWDMNGNSLVSSGIVANPGSVWQAVGQGGMHFIDATQTTGTIQASILNDDFVFTTSLPTAHTITGFDPLHDVITLNQSRFGTYSAITQNETQSGGSTILALGNGSTLTLTGILPSALSAKNFV